MDTGRTTNGVAHPQKIVPTIAQNNDDELAQSSNSTVVLSNISCINCSADLGGGHRPWLLPCLHTLCVSCWSSMASSNDITITCPGCKHVGRRADVVENVKLWSSGTKVETGVWQACGGCSEERSVEGEHFCVECKEHLCKDCLLAHQRVKLTKGHKIELKPKSATIVDSAADPDGGFWCLVHSGEALTLYCEPCAKLICPDCQLSDEHMLHKYHFIPDAASVSRQQISLLLTRLKNKKSMVERSTRLIEKRRTDIRTKEESVTDAIKKFQVQLFREINKNGQQLMSDLKMTCAAKLHQVSQNCREIDALHASMSHCVSFAENILNCTNDATLLNCCRTLAHRLSNIQEERCQVPNPHHVIDVRFEASSALIRAVSQLGVLITDGQPGTTGAPPTSNSQTPGPSFLPSPTTDPTIRTATNTSNRPATNLPNRTATNLPNRTATNLPNRMATNQPNRARLPAAFDPNSASNRASTDLPNRTSLPAATLGPNSALMKSIVNLNSIGTHEKLALLQNMQQLLRATMQLQSNPGSSVIVGSGSQISTSPVTSGVFKAPLPVDVRTIRAQTMGSLVASNLPIVTMPLSGRVVSASVRSMARNDSNIVVHNSGFGNSAVSRATANSIPLYAQGQEANNKDNSETNLSENCDVKDDLLITIEPTDGNYLHDDLSMQDLQSKVQGARISEKSVAPRIVVSRLGDISNYRPVNTLGSGMDNASALSNAARTYVCNNDSASGSINNINRAVRVIPVSEFNANSTNNSGRGRVLEKRRPFISPEGVGAMDTGNNDDLEIKRRRASAISEPLLEPEEIKRETETINYYDSRGHLGRVVGSVSLGTQDTLLMQNDNWGNQHLGAFSLQPLNMGPPSKNTPLSFRSTKSSDQINSERIATTNNCMDVEVPLEPKTEVENDECV